MPLYSNLSVAAITLDIASGLKEENLVKATRAIAQLPAGVDIAVLPELFSTAFIPDADACRQLAEDNGGRTMQWAKLTAKATGAAIAGSFLAKSSNELFNRAFFVEPTGDTVFYDKRHTFSLGKESDILSKGSALPPIIRFRGWNIAIFVCYDLRFPVWMRNAGMKYDLCVMPANWPASRAFAWEHLLQARAIENQAYIIGANRAGQDSFGEYDGTARIFDFKGRPIGQDRASCVHAILSKSDLHKFREEMPIWKDADGFAITDA